MNLTIDTTIPLLTVFVQGLLSFFSPCIFPLIPLYMGYLAGGTVEVDENGEMHYPRKKIMVNTIFFILGIGFAFILLGMGFTALGQVLSNSKTWLSRTSGIIMIFFGLYQLGILGKSKVLESERRLPLHFDKIGESPVFALIMGFTFSFAWTPCVGPVLASVLLMASSASSAAAGFGMIGIYMLGFVLPFLAVGLFTGTVLGFFKRHQNVIRYTVKAGGALLILMGVMTFTGWMNGLTGYLSSFGGNDAVIVEDTVSEDTKEEAENSEKPDGEEKDAEDSAQPTDKNVVPAPDFTLVDQYGNTHTLSDYKGKVVFLNFWATWCGPCKQEMPDIQKLYEEYGENSGELVILGIANPKTDEYPTNQDGTIEEITTFMNENEYTYPVVMDITGEFFARYGISAFPTTFMIDVDGNVYGYVSGSLTEDMMRSIITQTIEAK